MKGSGLEGASFPLTTTLRGLSEGRERGKGREEEMGGRKGEEVRILRPVEVM